MYRITVGADQKTGFAAYADFSDCMNFCNTCVPVSVSTVLHVKCIIILAKGLTYLLVLQRIMTGVTSTSDIHELC
jgi:hypothetical protein